MDTSQLRPLFVGIAPGATSKGLNDFTALAIRRLNQLLDFSVEKHCDFTNLIERKLEHNQNPLTSELKKNAIELLPRLGRRHLILVGDDVHRAFNMQDIQFGVHCRLSHLVTAVCIPSMMSNHYVNTEWCLTMRTSIRLWLEDRGYELSRQTN